MLPLVFQVIGMWADSLGGGVTLHQATLLEMFQAKVELAGSQDEEKESHLVTQLA